MEESVLLLAIVISFVLSAIGAFTAWVHLKTISPLKDFANFSYAIHALSYVILAGYILNFSYYATAAEGSNALVAGQTAVYLIAITNFGTTFYLQWHFQKYFKLEGKEFVKRKGAWN